MCQSTLEVRWFIPGKLPVTIKHWFKVESPGELLETEPESREDQYISVIPQEIAKIKSIFPYIRDIKAINLKFREDNLELKLRKQQLGTQQFNNWDHSVVWTGNIERWQKLNQGELIDYLSRNNSISDSNSISVFKKRIQKIEKTVKSELTQLKVNNQNWWSIAFEMTQESTNSQQSFQEVIQQTCQNYSGRNLLANNSYGYSHWLLCYYY